MSRRAQAVFGTELLLNADQNYTTAAPAKLRRFGISVLASSNGRSVVPLVDAVSPPSSAAEWSVHGQVRVLPLLCITLARAHCDPTHVVLVQPFAPSDLFFLLSPLLYFTSHLPIPCPTESYHTNSLLQPPVKRRKQNNNSLTNFKSLHQDDVAIFARSLLSPQFSPTASRIYVHRFLNQLFLFDSS
jgi:hypothetical protein